MKIPFIKMHGLGNDFVVVDERNMPAADWKNLAPKLLNRRFGVGGDSLLVIGKSEKSDARMRTFESDCRESEMCGNGIRSVALYLRETDGLRKEELTIETMAGMKTIRFVSPNQFRVDMGVPIFEPERIPFTSKDWIWGAGVSVEHTNLKMFPLSMGNPHAVVFVNNRVDLEKVKELGPLLEHDRRFPNRTNVEFVKIQDDRNIELRVWERGAGETMACGTGACAAAVAAIKEKGAGSPLQVHFKAGDLTIEWAPGQSVFMTGPAAEVFRGETNL